LLLGRDRAVGTPVAQEGKAETVGFVSGMDDGESLVEPPLARIEVGVADGRAVAGGVVANLVERVAEGRSTALGDLAQAFGVAGFIGDEIVAGKGPDASGGREARDRNDGGQVTGGEERADTRDRIEETSIRVESQGLDLGHEGGNAVAEADVGLEIVLEAMGIDGSDGRRRQGSLAEHGQDGVDGFGPGTTDLTTEKSLQPVGAESQSVVGIGSVKE